MDQKKNSWLVIVNPHAGGSKARTDWPKIHSLLKNEGLELDVRFSEYPHHAIELVKDEITRKGHRQVLAVGGDGTLNEVVNGIFHQDRFAPTEVTVGLITIGTGNDWGRMYAMPSEYRDQVKILKEGHSILQDVGRVKYLHDELENYRYFVNIAGMGFDALVAKKTNLMKAKGSGGPLSYLYSLVTGLFQFHPVTIEVEGDGILHFEGKVFSISIGICQFNGGGMKQLPHAIPNDGMFDVTLIRHASKSKVIRNIHKVYDGSFINLDIVETFTGREFIIRSHHSRKTFLETDGESLGHSPLHFTLVHRGLRMIVPKHKKQEFEPGK